MSDDNAQFKQRLERLRQENAPMLKENSHEDSSISKENGGLQSENGEWRRFYEVVKRITEDMRH
jgi:hypothetical protein